MQRPVSSRFAFLALLLAVVLVPLAPGSAARAQEQPTPLTPEQLTGRAQARLQAGDTLGAVEDLDAAIAGKPDFAPAWALRGVARSQLGEGEAALADLTKAVTLDPARAELWYYRAKLRAEANDLAGARRDLDEAIARREGFFFAFMDRASVRRRLGDLGGAIEDYGRAIELQPSFGGAYHDRGAARMARGDPPAEVLSDFDQAVKLLPEMPQGWTGRGFVLGVLGRHEEAAADFGRSLDLDREQPRVWLAKGHANRRAGDLEAALADFDQTIQRAPRQPAGWFGRATTRAQAGLLDDAIGDFDLGLGIDPSNPRALLGRGATQVRRRDFAAAIADLDASVAAAETAAAVGLRGRVKVLVGKRAEAMADLEQAARLEKGAEAYSALWLVCFGGARERLEEAKREGTGWFVELARFVLGEIDAATLLARAADAPSDVRRREQVCEAHGFIGVMADEAGDHARARSHYRACVETDIRAFNEWVWAKVRLPAIDDRRWGPF